MTTKSVAANPPDIDREHRVARGPWGLSGPAPAEVHVWAVALAAGQGTVRAAWQTLSADERARALRFHFPRERERYVVARAALRRIVGRYLEVSPDRVTFSYGPNGKPQVDGTALAFNLSHSARLALCAVGHTERLGVDLERVRPIGDVMQIAEHFFSDEECRVLRDMPPAARVRLFLEWWTLREAYLKGTGAGLPGGIKDLAVTLDERGISTLVCGNARTPLAGWTFVQLPLGQLYVGALAREGPVEGVCWRSTP